MKTESVEEFLARGGQVSKYPMFRYDPKDPKYTLLEAGFVGTPKKRGKWRKIESKRKD